MFIVRLKIKDMRGSHILTNEVIKNKSMIKIRKF